ncbi:hypothetical protein C8R47DRAFT_1198494 [Mycena vitilis]|nr:hypothetical protein C8R47DRAFT_1198494 [Mycena vitilis]
MFPNHNPTGSRGSSSSYPVKPPPPGHQRNRIACSNCRRRKVKCVTKEKQPRSPCERCLREGTTCEYIPASPTEERSSPPPTTWAEPLDPGSYARSQGVSAPPASSQPTGYSACIPQAAVPSGNYMAPVRQPEYPPSSHIFSPGSNYQPGIPGNQLPATNPAYFETNPPPMNYGVYTRPVNTVYPWPEPQTQPQ